MKINHLQGPGKEEENQAATRLCIVLILGWKFISEADTKVEKPLLRGLQYVSTLYAIQFFLGLEWGSLCKKCILAWHLPCACGEGWEGRQAG